MSSRRGLTLVEVLTVMAIILLLAGIVHPILHGLGNQANPAVMAATVRQIREQIAYHTGRGDVPMSNEGYPNAIDPAWFAAGRMPEDVWTNEPLSVQVVHGSKTATRPPQVFFNINPHGRPSGHTAWYNASNGSFCALVPKEGTPQEQKELFDLINGFIGDS
jgi:prepilin-type N-terminal cleavage/methylation domain-containing protein